MSAIFGFEEPDVAIAQNLLAGRGENSDKRIVGGMQNESRHGNAIQNMGGGGAVIIIVGACESAVVRRDSVVKIAQACDAAQPRSVKDPGKQTSLGTHPPSQLPQKILLVQVVAARVQ